MNATLAHGEIFYRLDGDIHPSRSQKSLLLIVVLPNKGPHNNKYTTAISGQSISISSRTYINTSWFLLSKHWESVPWRKQCSRGMSEGSLRRLAEGCEGRCLGRRASLRRAQRVTKPSWGGSFQDVPTFLEGHSGLGRGDDR